VLEKKLQRKFDRRIVVTRFDSRRKLAYDIFDRVKTAMVTWCATPHRRKRRARHQPDARAGRLRFSPTARAPLITWR